MKCQHCKHPVSHTSWMMYKEKPLHEGCARKMLDEQGDEIAGLRKLIPALPCCPDGFMDEPCTSLVDAKARVKELETEVHGLIYDRD